MGHGRAHSISRILQHHLSTIFASHYHHQPNPPTEPSNHNSMSSCHVKAFSNMRIDLLYSIVVTFATSHWLRSPLNFWASVNTVARKEGRLHSQSTRKKRSRKNPDQNTVKAQIMQNILRITYITPPTQTPEWTSSNHKSMFRWRYVILKHTYRLGVKHAGDTNQTISKQTLLSLHTLAIAPSTTTKLTLISPANEPPYVYTQKHVTSNKPSCTLYLPHSSTSTTPPSLHHAIKRRLRQTKKHEISSRNRTRGSNKHKISYAKLVTAQL